MEPEKGSCMDYELSLQRSFSGSIFVWGFVAAGRFHKCPGNPVEVARPLLRLRKDVPGQPEQYAEGRRRVTTDSTREGPNFNGNQKQSNQSHQLARHQKAGPLNTRTPKAAPTAGWMLRNLNQVAIIKPPAVQHICIFVYRHMYVYMF